MNLVLWAVSLGTVTILYGTVKAEQTCGIDKIDKDINLDILERPVPTTERGKCLYECMMRLSGLSGENGLVNVDKFVDYLKKARLYFGPTKRYTEGQVEQMTNIIDTCKMHKHISGKKCEDAALFLQCSSEQSTKNYVAPLAIPKAIFHAYRVDHHDFYKPKSSEPKGTFFFNWPSIEWWPKNKN